MVRVEAQVQGVIVVEVLPLVERVEAGLLSLFRGVLSKVGEAEVVRILLRLVLRLVLRKRELLHEAAVGLGWRSEEGGVVKFSEKILLHLRYQ